MNVEGYLSSVAAVQLYVDMLRVVLPCVFTFGACNLLINMILNAFFNGKLKLGGKI